MMKKVVALGLFALLLLGACTTSKPSADPCPSPVPAPCRPRAMMVPPERCVWPSVCRNCPEDPDAAQMLSGILWWANQTHDCVPQAIDGVALGRVRCRAPECMLSTLADNQGVPMAQLDEVAVCSRLRDIYDRARAAHHLAVNPPADETPEQKAVRLQDCRDRWHTVATDLDIFPSVQPPPP